MIICECDFFCRFTTAGQLPAFKGSMLRGAFGRALRDTSCTLKLQECKTCLLKSACVHAVVFEGESSERARGKAASQHLDSARPYVIEPPLEHKRTYSPGDPLAFRILLFGKAAEYLPHVICAVEKMGETGLGQKGDTSGRFALEAAQVDGRPVYDYKSGKLDLHQAPEELVLGSDTPNVLDTLRVEFVTPFRFKHQNRLRGDVPFHLLVRAALRRIAILEGAYGRRERSLDYRGIAARAASVGIFSTDCRWVDYERYDSRQKTRMRLGGIQEHVAYTGNLAEFLPYLRYCERVHLGKQTTFGYGKVRILAEAD
jgi:hypothetical protein